MQSASAGTGSESSVADEPEAVEWAMQGNLSARILHLLHLLRVRPLIFMVHKRPGFDQYIALKNVADFYALRKEVELAIERVSEVRQSAGLEQLMEEIASLEKKSADSSLWDDTSKAQGILVSLTEVKDRVKLLNDFKSQV